MSIFRAILLILLASGALSAQEGEKQQPPNPNSLQPGWWAYFRHENHELAQARARQSAELLEEKLTALPLEDQEEARSLISAFQKALVSLDGGGQAQGPEPIAPVLADSYSVESYLSLAKQVREARADEDALRHQLAQLRERNGLAERRFEARIVKFRADDSVPTAERFITGLKLMLQRAQVEVEKQSIEVLSEVIGRRSAHRDTLEQLLDNAQDRVSIQGENAETLAHVVKERKDTLQTTIRKGLEGENGGLRGSALPEMLYAQETLAFVKLLRAEMHLSLATQDDDTTKYGNWVNELERTSRLAEQWREVSSETLLRFSRQPGDVPETERDHVIALLNVAGELDEQLFLAREMLGLVQAERLKRRAPAYRVFDYLWINLVPALYKVADWMYYPILHVGEDEVPLTIWSLVKVALIFTVAIFLSRLLYSRLGDLARRRGGLSPTNFNVFGRLLHYALLSLAALTSLSVIGLRASTLVVLGGALGIGVGFGLQSFVQNFVSGLTILFERNFRIGDYIKLPSGEIGEVKEINTQSTVIHAFDGMDIVVPNGQLISLSIANWTLRDPFLRLHIPFGVAYGSDPQKVREVVLEAARQFESTLQDSKREPQVWMKELGDSSMNFELVVWVNVFKYPRHNSTRAAYLEAIERSLVQHGIVIPFPQRDLHIKSSDVNFV